MIQEPIQPVPTASPSRPTLRDKRRIGIVIALLIALAFPIVAILAAHAPATGPTSGLGVGASASPDAPDRVDGEGRGPKEGRGWKAFRLDKRFLGTEFGPGRGNGLGNAFGWLKGRGQVSIRAISGSQISLATIDGWSRTITATSETVITRGGQTIAVGDLKVGDEVGFGQQRNDDGSYTITAIWVLVPRAGGEVTKVDGNEITVSRGGTTRVITVNGSTTYTLGDAAATKADVTVGSEISAQGEVDGDAFTASAIEIELPHVAGVVTEKAADSMTVRQRDGTTVVIHVDGSTTYKVNGTGNAAASLGDIAVGDVVSAEGSLRANGSLDAASVHAGKVKGPKPFKVHPDDDADDAPA